MATIYDVQMFYIGNFADMDTDEGNTDNEDPDVVLGTHDDLQYVEIRQFDVDDDGVIYDDELGTGDYLSYDLGSGTTDVSLDSSSLYDAEILLGDGSIMEVPVLVLQADNGDVFISEYPASSLDGLSIQSINLVEVNTSDAAGIYAGASDVQNASVVCYGAGMMIDTPQGPRRVEDVQPGDFVTTLDHGAQEVLWVRAADYPLDSLPCDNRPVLIRADALGPARPRQDLIVSPQHRILVGTSDQLGWMSTQEAFAPAKALTELPKVRFMQGKSKITFVHFACARHEVVVANGCLSESLLLGHMVLNGLTPEERETLNTEFRPSSVTYPSLNGPPARTCLTVGEVKRRIKEHARQEKFLRARAIEALGDDPAKMSDKRESRKRHSRKVHVA